VAVAVSGYLMSGTSQRLRYPDLVRLLEQTRYEQYGSNRLAAATADAAPSDPAEAAAEQAAGTIVVPAERNPEAMVEFRLPQNIAISDNLITGTVEYRPLLRADAKPQRVSFRTERTIRNDAEDARLLELLDRSNVVWDTDRPNTFLADHGVTLLMIGVLLLFGFLMLKRISGVNSPMAFSRSRGKLYGQDDLPITFKDV